MIDNRKAAAVMLRPFCIGETARLSWSSLIRGAASTVPPGPY
jgi:hypothetical protein